MGWPKEDYCWTDLPSFRGFAKLPVNDIIVPGKAGCTIVFELRHKNSQRME
jgi:hypothetical protein